MKKIVLAILVTLSFPLSLCFAEYTPFENGDTLAEIRVNITEKLTELDQNPASVTLTQTLGGGSTTEAPSEAAVDTALADYVETDDLATVESHIDTFLQSANTAAARTAIGTVASSCFVDTDSFEACFNAIVLGSGSSDTLAGLSCSTDQIAKWNGSAWVCASDANSGGFAFDTAPTYEDDSYTSGLARSGTTLYIHNGSIWQTATLTDSLSASPSTYTLSGTITDTPGTGSTFTINSVAYDATDSPISISGLNSATQSIAFTSAGNGELGNCTATGLTGTADTGPWAVDMSSADVDDLACTVSGVSASDDFVLSFEGSIAETTYTFGTGDSASGGATTATLGSSFTTAACPGGFGSGNCGRKVDIYDTFTVAATTADIDSDLFKVELDIRFTSLANGDYIFLAEADGSNYIRLSISGDELLLRYTGAGNEVNITTSTDLVIDTNYQVVVRGRTGTSGETSLSLEVVGLQTVTSTTTLTAFAGDISTIIHGRSGGYAGGWYVDNFTINNEW